MSQYIGKTISLISNKQLRYVGLLVDISAEDATIALKSVRCFGTEGRLAQSGAPHLEVAPNATVYENVVFRGSDVKDLTVLDVPLDQVHPEIYTPAPQPGAVPPPPAPATAAPAPAPVQPPAAASRTVPRDVPTGTTSTPAPQPGAAPQPETPAPSGAVPDAQPATAPKPFSDDFDFESANARFERERAEMKQDNTYSKTSFFDTLTDSDSKPMRWNEEVNLNLDTFGETGERSRGRGRGRGRGGRGRGRGRGRGNYRGRNNDYNSKPEWA